MIQAKVQVIAYNYAINCRYFRNSLFLNKYWNSMEFKTILIGELKFFLKFIMLLILLKNNHGGA